MLGVRSPYKLFLLETLGCHINIRFKLKWLNIASITKFNIKQTAKNKNIYSKGNKVRELIALL